MSEESSADRNVEIWKIKKLIKSLEMARGFFQKFNFPGVLGCIDGTHVAILRPTEHEERYYNRKGFHSLNVMIICDADLNILCVDASNPGSAHDSAVWQGHPLSNHLNEITENTNEQVFLLGDSGYPLRKTMMTPILNTVEGTPQHNYYRKHVTARNTVERCIGVLKARFRNGTSMISLIIPPKDQISRVSKMLADEFGTASNIKSRVNRLSVLGAITSVQHRLKLYTKVPPNGLVIYCGTIVTEEGKEKKVNIDFEPFKPINTSLYLCDNKFHTEALTALLADDNKFGFIVMDGNGALFGTLQGNTREVLHKFTVDLPKKHGRGGQSALRFARLRMEKRHNYVRKVAEVATQLFISADRPNVAGLILAGSADFKTELSQSDMFDPRLQAKIIKLVDVSYGGENGFNQAIELAAESLQNVKFIQEKKLIGRYFDEISQDTGKYCFGVDDTLRALELGSVETLICWENLDIQRYVLKSHATNQETILHLTPEQEKDKSHFTDKESGVELELVECQPLLEWLANNYKSFGATLEIITDKSQEGSQFVRGFGGIGGLLRYKVDFQSMQLDDEEIDNLYDIDDY